MMDEKKQQMREIKGSGPPECPAEYVMIALSECSLLRHHRLNQASIF